MNTVMRDQRSSVVRLSDKYELTGERAYLTGIQALVRLPMVQRQRDCAQGFNTAGYVSGYRGSPLGTLDLEMWRARKHLEAQHIRFAPGVNEDLAATAIWGTQQVNLFEGARYDGVFGMWYGKGPGVDRSADALRHANAAGTAGRGGVLAIAGDDHACKSSSLPHQTDQVFVAVGIPLLAPSCVQDILDFGIHGWAMSRFSGCWVALKTVSDVVESATSADIATDRIQVVNPGDFALPRAGLAIRYPDPPLDQEARLLNYKLPAAQAYARANGLDSLVIDSSRARFGIASAGKSYLDVREALDLLGIDAPAAKRLGLRVFKVGLVWPLERSRAVQFAAGLEEVVVVEEKRAFLEEQLRDALYALDDGRRPRILGKTDRYSGPADHPFLAAEGDHSPAKIALALGKRILRFAPTEELMARVSKLEERLSERFATSLGTVRTPFYCSGCPHNTSTRVPDGSRATAGIGCHAMATFIYPSTKMYSHMGGEGVHWIGQQPFVHAAHVFANMGDGTYFHSGSLAIRAAVAAGTPVTFKILYNDAVAMTGGQPVDGRISVTAIARQLLAEGVERIIIVTDEPEKYASATDLPGGVPVHHRRELDSLQRDLRQYRSVSALIYDQTCAAEKRRRRKRGAYPDPAKRVIINTAVCEGCGDCSAKSNCISIVPVATELGVKRAIDQSSCNKDFSCVNGFCPSFVTVHGGRLRKRTRTKLPADFTVPEPDKAGLKEPFGILIAGVGGTGIVTIGALLGMAAHLEGKVTSVLDMTGLAQKGGSVWSHVRIASDRDALHSARIPEGEADAVIAADLLVGGSRESLTRVRQGVTRILANNHGSITGEDVRAFAAEAESGDASVAHGGAAELAFAKRSIVTAAGEANVEFVDATTIATALIGDSIATNVFLLGYAYQRGWIPLKAESLLRAIELNETAVEGNKASFAWGRRMAIEPGAVLHEAGVERAESDSAGQSLESLIEHRAAYLRSYQNARYATRFVELVRRVSDRETEVCGAAGRLTEAVARNYFKLLAYKDEYEVARLHSDPRFLATIGDMFEGDWRLSFNLAPPSLTGPGSRRGPIAKRTFGSWVLVVFRVLARMKGLRGSWADPFKRLPDRRRERALILEYEALLQHLLDSLSPISRDKAAEIAALPDAIRGYGHVKERHIERTKEREKQVLAEFDAMA